MENVIARLAPLLGIVVLIAICLAVSTERRAALKRWDLIAWGFGLQFLFALLVLKTERGRQIFAGANDVFVALINCTYAGADFVFGSLAAPYGDGNLATLRYVHAYSENPEPGSLGGMHGPIFAFYVLTTIIFFSALTSILYQLGVLQKLVKVVAWGMQRTLKTSGAETLSASANIFVGQTEAPLVVRPYLARMTKSELMTVMTGGFATVAGSVLGAYVAIMGRHVDNIGGHLIAASIMSAPAALVFGKLMVPETETPETLKTLDIKVEQDSVNVLDAATVGTSEGVRLALNVGGMLLAFLAIIALLDLMLRGSAGIVMGENVPDWLSVRGLLGFVFAPFAWLIGITDWNEAMAVGELMGIKMAANEFVAFLDLAAMSDAGRLSDRSQIIASYALAGFANFGSIGIQIGGLAVMAPERRHDLSRLGLRAMIAGTFAANSTACVAAVLI